LPESFLQINWCWVECWWILERSFAASSTTKTLLLSLIEEQPSYRTQTALYLFTSTNFAPSILG